jgi:hypothetical protein
VIWSALIFTDRTINVRSCCGSGTKIRMTRRTFATGLVKRVVPYRTAARCIRNGLNSGIAWSRHFAARELDRETEVQTKFLHLFGDFSQPAISRHMSGNSADMSKRYFQNCTASSSIPWSARKSLMLNGAQNSPHFSDQRRQFSERQFASAVLVAMVGSRTGKAPFRFRNNHSLTRFDPSG